MTVLALDLIQLRVRVLKKDISLKFQELFSMDIAWCWDKNGFSQTLFFSQLEVPQNKSAVRHIREKFGLRGLAFFLSLTNRFNLCNIADFSMGYPRYSKEWWAWKFSYLWGVTCTWSRGEFLLAVRLLANLF